MAEFLEVFELTWTHHCAYFILFLHRVCKIVLFSTWKKLSESSKYSKGKKIICLLNYIVICSIYFNPLTGRQGKGFKKSAFQLWNAITADWLTLIANFSTPFLANFILLRIQGGFSWFCLYKALRHLQNAKCLIYQGLTARGLRSLRTIFVILVNL